VLLVVVRCSTLPHLQHMTTLNPRVHVTLSPSLDTLVSRLATAQRTSKSDVVRELLEAAAPSLERAVALMEAAARAKPEMLRGMATAMANSQARIEGILEGVVSATEAHLDLVQQAEAVKARRPARRRAEPGAGAGALRSPGASRAGARSAPVAPPPSKRGGK
jgi:hypothetical protein